MARPHIEPRPLVAVARALLVTALVAACVGAARTAAPTGTTPTATTPTAATASPTLPATPSLPTTPATARATIAPLVDAPLAADVAERLQAALDEYAVEGKTAPSVSAAVIVPGEGVWSGVAGLADIEEERPPTPETAYGIGSVTKTFVAALILLLVRDDVVALDDPAAKWLDEPAAEKSNEATIRDLLGHRSGIANYTDNDDIIRPNRTWTPAEILDLAGPRRFAPGERFEYSNTNYVLLGLVAERAGVAPLEVQLRERLLEPNGLKRTFLSGREKVEPPFAIGYSDPAGLTGDLYDESGYIPSEALATGAWAAGAMASTPTDIARWLHSLASGTVLGADLTADMFPPPDGPAYGLGIDQIEMSGAGMLAGHIGGIPGYVAFVLRNPQSGHVVAFAANTSVIDPAGPLEDLFAIIARD